MDNKRQQQHSTDPLSFSNLFNLEPLMNFQLPQRDDDFDYYGNSSQDESRGSQGGVMMSHGNGTASERDSSLSKRRRQSCYSDEDEESYFGIDITEDHYRAMLGEHLQTYRRKPGETPAITPLVTQMGVPVPKSNSGLKGRKLGNGQRERRLEVEAAPEWLNNVSAQKAGSYPEKRGASSYGTDHRLFLEPAYLDIANGITYQIPPSYDTLASSLNLPNLSDIRVDEFYLQGTLDLGSLATMMASDKKLGSRNWSRMGDPRPQYGSLQARLKALSASNSSQNFSLKVSDVGLESSIPEGAAGSIKRLILSEGGVLQVYYVKVLEKGDSYEIIERSLPKKPKVEKDRSAIEREERKKIGKVWVNIARRDIPKHHRNFATFHRKQLMDAKRFSENCQREVKLKDLRSQKFRRGAPIRTRKITREVVLFWKRYDKEQAEVRRKEEREAAEALRRKQELEEAQRQQKRLDFLIKQTELYSHFMQNKSDEKTKDQIGDAVPDEVEDDKDAELAKEAWKAAQAAVSKQKQITSAFDTECSNLREAAETGIPSLAGSSDIDLQTPSTMPVASTVKTPELFHGSLKEYQLKGLQWLVNCYDQGLNGILADEMGLGKTIQAMVFLAHLAEEKNIWGPFLVVAPASVLNNWTDEISRFCPDLKTLPYWGGLQERVVLRKNLNPKRLYRRDAGFHILITSYQLLVTDEKHFRRVKWQYMVLDEAQAIKSSTSIRWKTLLSFNCRNRLLLTGTPIQNNMAELWALLHFIMPTLFDSHEQFNEWFSKGIESHAEHGGTLNEHQLNRLHAILKPFMLRRVKKDVVSELTKKTEITVHCKLSSRQKAFYRAIKDKISLSELVDGNRGQFNERKIMNLMNIVIQLRKVCNHPELFERNEGSSYFYFADVPNSLLLPPFGELEDIHYPGGRNLITYEIPKLVYQEVVRSGELPCSTNGHGLSRELFEKYFNIHAQENVYRSTFPLENESRELLKSGPLAFTRLMDLSAAEVSFLATSTLMERVLFSMMRQDRKYLDGVLDSLMESMTNDPCCNHMEKETVRAVTRMLLLPSRTEANILKNKVATGPAHGPFEALVIPHSERLSTNINLLYSTYSFIPQARAPPINAHCSDRHFSYNMAEELHNPRIKRLLVGFARTSDFNGPRKPEGPPHHLIQEIDCEVPVSQPALQLTHQIFGSAPPVQSFDPAKLLTDSGKLQTLDILLKRLRAENHRVLLFAQMTKMLNILEDYMNYRKYKYLRLDGSSTIMDRRDMVKEFQQRSDIFVFLLSTRAGGLGINLTAADTVIFYESDWNPTLDLQAMDRAHRLGQTKDVTVYRLICKETVEEKILQRASQKHTVQQLVMTGGHVQGDLLAPEDVISLLLDDSQLERKLKEITVIKDRQKRKQPTRAIRVDVEGDAHMEDLTNMGSQGADDASPAPDKAKPSSKKRKSVTDRKTTKPRHSQNSESNPVQMDYEFDNSAETQSQKPKRPKRPKKSVNDNLEPAFAVNATSLSDQSRYPPTGGFNSGSLPIGGPYTHMRNEYGAGKTM